MRSSTGEVVIVKVLEAKVAWKGKDFSGRITPRKVKAVGLPSFAEDIVKVDVTLAPGLQAKDPSRRPKSATSLDAFRDSAAGALPAIWAKLPQSLVLRGEDKGWRKMTKRCKDVLIGREPKP